MLKRSIRSAENRKVRARPRQVSARSVELIALLVLIALATVVYMVAGSTGFSVITSAGGGLFATWRAGEARSAQRYTAQDVAHEEAARPPRASGRTSGGPAPHSP